MSRHNPRQAGPVQLRRKAGKSPQPIRRGHVAPKKSPQRSHENAAQQPRVVTRRTQKLQPKMHQNTPRERYPRTSCQEGRTSHLEQTPGGEETVRGRRRSRAKNRRGAHPRPHPCERRKSSPVRCLHRRPLTPSSASAPCSRRNRAHALHRRLHTLPRSRASASPLARQWKSSCMKNSVSVTSAATLSARTRASRSRRTIESRRRTAAPTYDVERERLATAMNESFGQREIEEERGAAGDELRIPHTLRSAKAS